MGISERKACRFCRQSRATQRRKPADPRPDDDLRRLLRQISKQHPRWGYRRAWGHLRNQGIVVNRKKIQRLWREEGLKVPAQTRKRRRLGTSDVEAARLTAQAPDHVWALDYEFDQTVDGQIIKILNIVDEHTREALTVLVDRHIDADKTVAVLDSIVSGRGRYPSFVRSDNGPELTSYVLRDWCRLSGTGASFIEPGTPRQNPYVESFGGKLRDEVLNTEIFTTLLEAQVVIEDWRNEYNHVRPHSSLDWKPPAQYASIWTDKNQPILT